MNDVELLTQLVLQVLKQIIRVFYFNGHIGDVQSNTDGEGLAVGLVMCEWLWAIIWDGA